MTARRRARRDGPEAPERAVAAPDVGGPLSQATQSHTDPLSAIYDAMSEAQFQRTVRTHLKQRGFMVWVFPIMKRTMAGVPDLTFWHPERPGLLWCWELKSQRGRIRPEQATALKHLASVPGIDARVVRPGDWEWLRDKLEQSLFGPVTMAAIEHAAERRDGEV